ncbi:MAG: ABC transporter permease [Nitrospirae bacterium]|nr:MAG: ABC transporter permease [Nitrospirota bacterium]
MLTLKLIRKEILHILRDRGLLLFIIYAFTIDIMLAAKGFQLIPVNVSIAVMDEDHSPESRALIDRIRPPAFRPPRYILSKKEMDLLLEKSKVVLSLHIPHDFEENLYRDGSNIQILVDGSQSTAAYLSSAYISEIINSYSLDVLKDRAARSGTSPPYHLELRPRIMFNQEARDDIYEGLNEFFMVITLIGMILPAMLLIREREYGTIEQIRLSPLSLKHLVTVKMMGATIFLLVATVFSYIFILKGVLRFPLKGTLPSFLAITAFYLIATSGLAFIIGSVARRFSQIGMLTIVIFAPMLLLSGGWVPPEALPDWLRVATNISPLKQYIDLGVSHLIRGTPLAMLLDKIGRMLFLGMIFLSIGGIIFTRRIRRY